MITLEFAVPVRKIYANQKVREDAGCVALMRGPMVYCFEGVDNPGLLQSFCLPKELETEEFICEEGCLKGNVLLRVKATKFINQSEALYTELPPEKEEATLTAAPYYTWGNRGENQMRVWIHGA